MGLRNTFLNALGIDTHNEVQKASNSAHKSARDFFRYGNRDKLYPTWAEIKMPDQDMYRGYSYAVIQKRGNKVASLAKENLKTWANPEIIDEYQKKNETVEHPYIKLISDSTKFTEKQFWKNISIYLDLAGRYYLGVLRSEIRPLNPKLPIITTDPTEFIMLNPYEIRRVINADGQVAGYIERKSDGRYREWPLYQIIEMRELNPFDPDNSQWAMTDAAKSAVYTMNQSGDYTIQSLHGNIEAPGIITTDVLLSDEDFENFRQRVSQHTKGEPLFGNGAGAIKWDSMQIDLDKAALMDINEINRTTLFAVSGTSKTSLGIEQSGTTRETARVQSEQFVSDTAQPRLEDIVDFLNLDYKKHYNIEYKKTGYYIEIKSAVGTDYATETQAVGMRQAQIQLAMQLIQSGYTMESAYQYAAGEIELGDLELEKGLDKPNAGGKEGGDMPTDDGGNDNPTPSNSPKSPTTEEEENSVDFLELTSHSELQENGGKGSGNHGHAGRPGEVGGSAPQDATPTKTSITAKVDGPDDDYIAIDDKTGTWTDKIQTHYKTYKYGDDSYKAVTAEYVPEPDVLLIEGEGRNPDTKEKVDLLGFLDNYPNDTDVAKALWSGRLKSLDQLGDSKDEWDIIKAHLSKMNVRAEDERRKAKNSIEDEKCDPLENLECTCEHDHKIDTYINRVSEQQGKVVNESYKAFLDEIKKIEKETINAVATKLTVNAFTQDDLLGKRKKKNLLDKLKNAIYQYWWALLPMFATNTMDKRNAEFDEDVTFVFTNDVQNAVSKNADKVAEGHLNTILDDILEVTNKAYTEVQEQAAADLIVTAYEKMPAKFDDYFHEPPTRVQALEAVRKTDILERNRKIYEEANRMAYEGFNRQTITKAIRAQYKEISKKRANTIARNETARAFVQSQFEADRQFLNSVGKIENAYKVLYSRRPDNEKDKICPYCAELIRQTNEHPIPFEEPFLAFGDSIEVFDNGKVRTFTANYEDIQGGVVHPNCQCDYHLVFKNSAGEFVKTLNKEQHNGLWNKSDNLGIASGDSGGSSNSDNQQQTKSLNGGKGSGNHGHAGRPTEVGGSAPKGTTADALFESNEKDKADGFRKLALDEQIKFCERAINETKVPDSLSANDFQKISYALGLNNKPQVLSDKEFDKQVADNNLELLHRVVKGNEKISAQAIADQLKNGEYTFQGNGMTEGTFFTRNPGLLWKYEGSGDSARTTGAISKEAKIANFDDEKLQKRFAQLEKRAKGKMDISTLTSVAILSAGYDGMSYDSESVSLKVRSYVCFIRRDNLLLREHYDTQFDKAERSAV